MIPRLSELADGRAESDYLRPDLPNLELVGLLTADGPASGGRYDPAEAYSVSLASGNFPSAALRRWGSDHRRLRSSVAAPARPFPGEEPSAAARLQCFQVVIDLVPDRILDGEHFSS